MARETDLDDPRPAAPTVEQQIPVDGSPDEVWEQLTGPDGLDWLGDDVELDLVPGGAGRVVDDDVTREVLVTDVDPERGLGWHWWSDPGDLSTVHITLRPFGDDGDRTLVHVIETLAAPASTNAPRAQASAARRGRGPTAFGTSRSTMRLQSRTSLVVACR